MKIKNMVMDIYLLYNDGFTVHIILPIKHMIFPGDLVLNAQQMDIGCHGTTGQAALTLVEEGHSLGSGCALVQKMEANHVLERTLKLSCVTTTHAARVCDLFY